MGKFIIWVFGIGGAMLVMFIGGAVQNANLKESHRQDLLAAIRDSGCNSHKQLHIEQEHNLRIDKYNLKKGFGE